DRLSLIQVVLQQHSSLPVDHGASAGEDANVAPGPDQRSSARSAGPLQGAKCAIFIRQICAIFTRHQHAPPRRFHPAASSGSLAYKKAAAPALDIGIEAGGLL